MFDPRPHLPNPSENPDVWCERCQRVHKRYTFTQQDYDQIIATNAKALADRIDEDLANVIAMSVKSLFDRMDSDIEAQFRRELGDQRP